LLVNSVDAQLVRVVENWTNHQLNAKATQQGNQGEAFVPAGWKELPDTLSLVDGLAMRAAITSKYSFEIGANGSEKVLHLKSISEHSTIVKDLRGFDLDLAKTPLLNWKWRVEMLPKGADLSNRDRSDSAAEIHLVWRAAGRMIGYAWDEALPVGHQFDGPRAPPRVRVRFFIVGSGTALLGQWLEVTRDVREDYRRAYNAEPPGPPDQIAISIDTNQTKSTAESFIGAITFRAP